MNLKRANKERIIENYLKDYKTYKIGVLNCKKQLQYLTPTLVSTYNSDGSRPEFFIPNDTAQVVIERTEGSQATELKKEIERFTFIIDCIDRAVDTLHDKQKLFIRLRYFQGLPMRNVMEQLDFMEERSAYRLRRKVLDKLLISLNNLLTFK